ncbi:heterokaryon incompatibility protein-domain-containing protein [Lophiotrema nucula]|uniref:Heterokaryon incompatibility protein-domain-containing protein n=1 Tax=Lophiotrema nucula TaxID=690887 RepID=A0A6A5ZKX6_9PLEO|nr:heterokaryon incompatibility protein-domain-containing protein [Lophiotrema nucula]
MLSFESILFLSSVVSVLGQSGPLPKPQLDIVDYYGSACPAGGLSASIGPINATTNTGTLSFTLSNFAPTLGSFGSVLRMCDVLANVSVASGWKVAVNAHGTQAQGYATFDNNTMLALRSTYQFTNNFEVQSIGMLNVDGPLSGQFARHLTPADGDQGVTGPCEGGQMDIEFQSRAVGSYMKKLLKIGTNETAWTLSTDIEVSSFREEFHSRKPRLDLFATVLNIDMGFKLTIYWLSVIDRTGEHLKGMAAPERARSFNLDRYRYSNDRTSSSKDLTAAVAKVIRSPNCTERITDQPVPTRPNKRLFAQYQDTRENDGKSNKRIKDRHVLRLCGQEALNLDYNIEEQDPPLCESCQTLDLGLEFARTDVESRTKLGRGVILRVFNPNCRSLDCGLCRMLLSIGQQQTKSTYLQDWHVEAYSISRRLSIKFGRDVPLLTVRSKRSTQSIMSFMMPVRPDDPRTVSARNIHGSIDWNIVKYWLSFCKEKHSRLCGKCSSFSTSGLKVIDCTTRRIVTSEPSSQYVTLSYVWGEEAIESMVGNVLPNQLPRTIEAAIEAVKSVGHRYLWIDRYCVPQGDEQEKHSLIQNMGQVYENSVLTLIAATGEDPHYGLPGVGTCARNPQTSIRIKGQQYIAVNLRNIDKELKDSKWNSRGWTYQEALLSRRKLVCTKYGLYFQCQSMTCYESLSFPLKPMHTKNLQETRSNVRVPRLFPSRGVGKSPMDIIICMNAYCQRDFKYDADALNAFQGILTSFGRMRHPVRHLYGVPLFPPISFVDTRSYWQRLIFGLSWAIIGPAVRRKEHPSWTWLGWKTTKNTSIQFGFIQGEKILQKRFYDSDLWPKITIETGDGKLYDWSHFEEGHTDHYANSSLPKYLHIEGYLLDIRLVYRKTWIAAELVNDGSRRFSNIEVSAVHAQIPLDTPNERFHGTIFAMSVTVSHRRRNRLRKDWHGIFGQGPICCFLSAAVMFAAVRVTEGSCKNQIASVQ